MERTLGAILGAILLGLAFVHGTHAQENVIASYDGTAGFQGPIWIAQDLGLFEKHGLKCQLVMIPGGARGMQALLSGSSHFAQGSATAPLSISLQKGELVIVAAALNKFPFSLVAQKEIVKPSDLRGKKIGIVNFGGSNELAVLLALKEWNIPRESVTILPSGEAAVRLVAMTTKALDATVLAPPETTEATRLGLNMLAHMSDLKASFPQTVITVRRSFVEKNRGTVKRFVRAYSEAIYQFMTNKEKTMAVYSSRLKQKNPRVIEETYNYYAGKFSLPPRVSQEGLSNALSLISQRTPGMKGEVNLGEFIEEGIIDELEKEGFFNKLQRGSGK